MTQLRIDPYDQATLDYLVAAGVDLSVVERVNRLAKDAAAWKQEAEHLAARMAVVCAAAHG